MRKYQVVEQGEMGRATQEMQSRSSLMGWATVCGGRSAMLGTAAMVEMMSREVFQN
jgi:hypothetical protein